MFIKETVKAASVVQAANHINPSERVQDLSLIVHPEAAVVRQAQNRIVLRVGDLPPDHHIVHEAVQAPVPGPAVPGPAARDQAAAEAVENPVVKVAGKN